MWYLADSQRFADEAAALLSLEKECDWLTLEDTRLDAGKLVVEVEIRVEARTYPATLNYPGTFPHSPPSVSPRIPARWSGHQYGRGELCLEWGPDNWQNDLTGADMVRSAYKLLATEAPSGDLPGPIAPSRHATTIGQDLRHEHFRLLLTKAFVAKLQEAEGPFVGGMAFYLRSHGDVHIIVPIELDGNSPKAWRDHTVSAGIEAPSAKLSGRVAVLPAGEKLPSTRISGQFLTELRSLGCDLVADRDAEPPRFLITSSSEGVNFLWLRDSEEPIWEFVPVPEGGGVRSDPARSSLAGKKVGFVGSGSVGSKIAVSLARTGVRDFVLIDDDVLLPENLVRSELDWDGIGFHKVDGLARRIEAVAPGSKCVLRRHRLGGQESNGGVNGALGLLRDCDLIIDATADPRVFNLLGAVSSDGGPPLIWVEVYGGGIGGLIARSRPGIDPSPQIARARIDAWCADKAVVAPRPSRRYEADLTEGPAIADDADVAVVTAHAARFAIDLLTEPNASEFPVSAYFIGLKKSWIFEQPFHSFPVDLGPAEARSLPASNPAALSAIAALLIENRDRSAAA